MSFNLIVKSPDEIRAELCRRIKAIRLDQNLSQQDLSAKCGVSRRTIQALEANDNPTLDTLVRVLHSLGIDCAAVVPEPPTVQPLALISGDQPRQRASCSHHR